MPLLGTLPPEIWYRIVEVDFYIDNTDDLKAMLAVAPQTTAKGMHDAALYLFFRSLIIWLYEGSSRSRYAAVEFCI